MCQECEKRGMSPMFSPFSLDPFQSNPFQHPGGDPEMRQFKEGDLVTVKESGTDKYRHTKPGVICHYHKFESGRRSMFSDGPKHIVVPLKLIDGSLDAMSVDPSDLRRATTAEIEKHFADVKKHNKNLTNPQFKPGRVVQLRETVEKEESFFFFTFTVKYPKGLEAVIDKNPFFSADEKAINDDGETIHEQSKDSVSQFAKKKIGNFEYKDAIKLQLGLYFPERNEFVEMAPKTIEEKIWDEDADKKLILKPGYFQKIMNVVNRVIKREIHSSVYDDLGLSTVCQKGKGAIILLYGPPGTGKTMTAEVVAEKLKRPLIRSNLSSLDGNLQKSLKNAFKLAKRFNGILLLDEVDVFIRKRGGHVIMDENTSVFLRMLEYYDGILFMTTNLANMVDHAVFSRVHVTLYYDTTSKDDRVQLWKTMMPPKLKDAIMGTEDNLESFYGQLGEYKLNGREIKNVIQNVVTRAVTKFSEKEIPKTKWIPRNYFLEEAETLQSERDSLNSGGVA